MIRILNRRLQPTDALPTHGGAPGFPGITPNQTLEDAMQPEALYHEGSGAGGGQWEDDLPWGLGHVGEVRPTAACASSTAALHLLNGCLCLLNSCLC